MSWIECIAIIDFDLALGQKVAELIPFHYLTPDERQQLGHSAFPDSNPDCEHCFIYSFTFRRIPDPNAPLATGSGSGTPPPVMASSLPGTIETAMDPFLHGMSYYRTKRDPSCQRGYVQQGIVVLSRLDHYLAVHEKLLRTIAVHFGRACGLSPDTASPFISSPLSISPTVVQMQSVFDHPMTQQEVIRRAWDEIQQWPTPHPHVDYKVSLLGETLEFSTAARGQLRRAVLEEQNTVRLDDRVRLRHRTEASATPFTLLGMHGLLGGIHLGSITQLWELLIAAQPILVLSNTPSMCSAVVTALRALIQPIEFNGEFHPFFTVQDPLFKKYMTYGKPIAKSPQGSPGNGNGSRARSASGVAAGPVVEFPAGKSIIIGCTNPFFVKAFDGWPNVLSVSDPYAKSKQQTQRAGSSGIGGGMGSPSSSFGGGSPSSLGGSTPTMGIAPNGSITAGSAPGSVYGAGEEFRTNRSKKFALNHKKQTESLSKLLGSAPKSMPFVQDDVVKKFMVSLTKQFLMPINACFNLIASQTKPFQLCCGSSTNLFSRSSFMNYVNTSDLPEIFSSSKKKEAYALYSAFIDSENFTSWIITARENAIQKQLDEFQIEDIDHLHEMELVDAFLNLYNYAELELHAVDVDIVLISAATSVLAQLALCLREELREDFIRKLDRLKVRSTPLVKEVDGAAVQ